MKEQNQQTWCHIVRAAYYGSSFLCHVAQLGDNTEITKFCFSITCEKNVPGFNILFIRKIITSIVIEVEYLLPGE